jgi:cysteinyl-tRNA synthetase
LTLVFEPKELELPQQMLSEIAAKHGLDAGDHTDASQVVTLLTEKRNELRRAKEWGLADQIRNDLHELGITLEDTPQGTLWRLRKP